MNDVQEVVKSFITSREEVRKLRKNNKDLLDQVDRLERHLGKFAVCCDYCRSYYSHGSHMIKECYTCAERICRDCARRRLTAYPGIRECLWCKNLFCMHCYCDYEQESGQLVCPYCRIYREEEEEDTETEEEEEEEE